MVAALMASASADSLKLPWDEDFEICGTDLVTLAPVG
jgi:hypothetical protein